MAARPLFLAALLLPGIAFADGPTWEQIASTDSWEAVATKKRDGVGTIEILRTSIAEVGCYRGIAMTDVTAEAMLGVITDIASAVEWSSAGVREAAVLGESGGTLFYYQYLDVPGWTMSADRFWFLSGSVDRDGDTIWFHWQRVLNGGAYSAKHAEIVAANPKAIEPPINIGGWRFRPVEAGTEVEYTICSDVGGSIPTGVQNAATKGTLPDTVGDMIAEARRRSE